MNRTTSATAPAHLGRRLPDALQARADAALYAARHAGHDAVAACEETLREHGIPS